MTSSRSAWTSRLLLAAVLAVYGVALGQHLNLATADVGRHLKNGELTVTRHTILSTNFYSYTEPDHPAINHHWGSGAIFYLVWRAVGFTGLHLFFIGLSLLALALLWQVAAGRAGPGLAALVFVLVAPLLAERRELRPEVFSYLFGAWFLHQLWRVRDGRASLRSLWILPFIEIAWVNTHIYFCFGSAFIGAFLLEALIQRDRRHLVVPLAKVLAATLAAMVLNPFGVHGALAPLTIFHEYGYRVLENQPVWFLEKLLPAKTNFLLFKIVFGAMIGGLVLAWAAAGQRLLTAETFLAAGWGAMGWLALRNFTWMGLIGLVIISTSLGALCRGWIVRWRGWLAGAGLLAAAIVLGLMLRGVQGVLLPFVWTRGLGVLPGNDAAAKFIIAEELEDPIFNNYDIGGYLIFHLFPRHRVFVDNRPEAYSVDFFRKLYVPMQDDEAVWRQADARYQFQTIVFQRNDATPWAQKFLINRVRDPAWAPVFVDGDALILVRRTERHAALISRYEIPQDRFQVSNPSTPRAGVELKSK